MSKRRERDRDALDPDRGEEPVGSTDEAGEESAEAPAERRRRTGPLEGLYQEFVRRAAGVGLSGFVLTEEALRRAFAESLPSDWMESLARQGSDARKELLEAMMNEFGEWLNKVDPQTLQKAMLHTLLEDFELKFEIKISAEPKSDRGEARSLELVRRSK